MEDFAFLHQKVSQVSMGKRRRGIFDGLQVTELIKDDSFNEAMNPAELFDWLSLNGQLRTSLAATEILSIRRLMS